MYNLRDLRCARWLRTTLSVVGVTLSLLATTASPTACEELRDVRVGRSVWMRVPEHWIDFVSLSERDGDVILSMRWPNQTGFHDGHEADHRQTGRAHADLVEILLTLHDRINPLDERARLNRSIFILTPHPPIQGLEHWSNDAPEPHRHTTQHELYVLRDEGGHLKTYINCDLPGTVPHPQCTAEFNIGPFLAHLRYARELNPEWQSIESSVQKQVLSFIQ